MNVLFSFDFFTCESDRCTDVMEKQTSHVCYVRTNVCVCVCVCHLAVEIMEVVMIWSINTIHTCLQIKKKRGRGD